MSILVVGTVAFDSIETPFGTADKVLGGSATYLSLSARHFCNDVRLVSVVGGDFPHEYLSALRDRGIDTAGLDVIDKGKTFAWSGRYHYDLNERDTLDTRLGVVESYDPQIPEAYKNSEVVCLGNLDPSIQLRVLEQVDSPGYVICDTMNFWIENTPDSLQEVLKAVDCLVINDAEARELADDPNLVRAAHIIRDMGPESLVIKKGEHGALLFTEDVVFSAPAYPLEDIQDPTGAGDTFAGGLAGHIFREGEASTMALKTGVIYGSALASHVVEQFGPDKLFEIDLATINKRAQAFRELSRIPEFDQLVA